MSRIQREKLRLIQESNRRLLSVENNYLRENGPYQMEQVDHHNPNSGSTNLGTAHYRDSISDAPTVSESELMTSIDSFCSERDEVLLDRGQSKRRYSTDTPDLDIPQMGGSPGLTELVKQVKGYCNTIRSYHGRNPQ